MDEIVERVENNFINIYNKFNIIGEKLSNYHIKIDGINDMIDLIISNEYNKIYKTYYPIKNYDLSQDRFFIYSEIIDIPLKKNSYIIFEYIFNSEYIDIPLIINLKIDDILEKDFNVNLKEYNKIRYMFRLLLLLLLGVDVYHLGMSLSRPLAASSTTVLSLAMSLATTRHAAT